MLCFNLQKDIARLRLRAICNVNQSPPITVKVSPRIYPNCVIKRGNFGTQKPLPSQIFSKAMNNVTSLNYKPS